MRQVSRLAWHAAAWAVAIARIAEDPELAARMGRQGRARAEREFSAERHVQGILDVYERVTA